MSPENNPEAGIFYRSDHFSLAKQGVPVLYAKGGVDHFTLGREYGEREAAEFIANRYHKVADKYDPEWDLPRHSPRHVGVFSAPAVTWPIVVFGRNGQPVMSLKRSA